LGFSFQYGLRFDLYLGLFLTEVETLLHRGPETSVEGVFIPKLFIADTGVETEIQGGVSYLRVGRASHVSAAEETDVAPDGYLRGTLAAELRTWLGPPGA
jgi:hypothetical protein